MADRTVTIDLVARDRASAAMGKFGDSADRAARRTQALKRIATVAGVAIAGLAIKVGRDSVHAYVDAQTQQAKLEQAFQKFPGLADTNIEALRQLNTQLALKTKFDDDATASGQAVLAQFNLTGQQITQLTPLLQDYAAKTGKDLPTAATDLGKAVLGQGRALKAVGVNFVDTKDKAGNFYEIMNALNGKVGGFAENEGKTAAGQAEILKNQFGEVEESIGSKLVPTLTKLATKLLEVINFVQRNSAVLGPLAAVIGTVGGAIFLIVQATKAWTAVQTALNVILTANPIGLVVVAIGLLVAGLIIAYKKSETFRNIVNGAFHGVEVVVGNVVALVIDGFRHMLDVWLVVAGGIVHGAATALGWIPGLGGKLKRASDAFDTMRGDIDSTLTRLADEARGLGNKTGSNFAAGIAAGIRATTGLAVGAAGDLSNSIAAKSRAILQERSPSKVGIDIGAYFSEGIGLGITKGGKKALAAVGTLIESVKTKLGTLKGDAAGILSSVGDSVRGVLDVSAFGAPIVTGQDASGNDITRTPGVAETASGFATQAKAFVDALRAMSAKKLAPSLIAAVAAAGPVSGLTAAQAFAASSASDVASVNASIGQINTLAGQAGNIVLKTTRLPAEIKREEDTLATLRRIETALSSNNVADITIKGDDLRVILKRAEKKADRR